MFLRKGLLKICSKVTGEHPCRSATSIKLQSNCIEITLWHGCSPVNWLHLFRTPFPRSTSVCLLLRFTEEILYSILMWQNIATCSLKSKVFKSSNVIVTGWWGLIPASIYLFKVNNRNTRKRCEICSKLTIKTLERRQ